MPVRLFRFSLLVCAALGSLGAAHAEEAEEAGGAKLVDEVVVTRAARDPVASATGLPLSLRDTPQQVTVIHGEQIRAFGLTSVNGLLAQVPGVNVEQVETDRTYYNARGFDITNFQVDGIGLPLIWGIQFGALDTALFDRVEVVRGANSLMTGVGNPSATVNYLRKRPTAAFQGDVAAEVGSWGFKRAEADVSGPLDASGSLRGRLVAVGQASRSYLDRYRSDRNVLYGVVAWDATPDLTLTAGYSRHDNRAHGVLWGALPLDFSDGTRVPYAASASTSADWTYWNVLDQTTFAEAAYALPRDWRLKATATFRSFDENAKLLYAYGAPDPVTGLGVLGTSGQYPSRYRQYLLDVSISGPVELFGRSHQLAFGLSGARNTGREYENASPEVLAYPAVSLWGVKQLAEPNYAGAQLQADLVDKLYRAYASGRFVLTDRLTAIVGATAVKLSSRGFSYGVDAARRESKLSPYAGLVYDLTPQVSVYASYTDIFNPQSETDVNHRTLAAAHGKSVEAGIKSEFFDRRLYLTAAVYRAEQLGLADVAGVHDNGKTYYAGLDTKVAGVELEAAGRITDRWTLSGGYTDLEIDGPTEAPIRTYVPRRTFKAATTYAFPELRNLALGAAVRWQDHVSTQDVAVVRQKAYAVVDLMAAVDLTDHVRATLNVKNLADDKHLTSLLWTQAFYAEPRRVSLRLDYAF